MKTAMLIIAVALVGALAAFNYGSREAGPEPEGAPRVVASDAEPPTEPRSTRRTVPTALPELAPATDAPGDADGSSPATRRLDTRTPPDDGTQLDAESAAAPEDEAATSPENAATASPEDAATTTPERAAATSAERAAAASPDRAATTSPENAATTSPENAATTSPENAIATSPDRSATMSPENAATTLPDPAATASTEDAARSDRESARAEAESRRGSRRSRWYRWDENERYPNLDSWVRPEGPVKIALQAGHWKSAEAPAEQAGLRNNGTRGGGLAEWQVNLAIARKAAALLEDEGYAVEILPTTIPPGYFADVFVSIHADGNNSSSVSGYRAASPRRDRTGRADAFADVLTRTYGAATGLRRYPTITRRMSSYYAFNYRRYLHSLHPMTVGVILETGFLTSARDRRIIVDEQERAARGIVDAVLQFLNP